jgi:hypothetical protein
MRNGPRMRNTLGLSQHATCRLQRALHVDSGRPRRKNATMVYIVRNTPSCSWLWRPHRLLPQRSSKSAIVEQGRGPLGAADQIVEETWAAGGRRLPRSGRACIRRASERAQRQTASNRRMSFGDLSRETSGCGRGVVASEISTLLHVTAATPSPSPQARNSTIR